MKRFEEDSRTDQAYTFGVFQNDNSISGTINLFQVLRGSIQYAFIGYFFDEERQNGKGYMSEL